MNRPGFLRRGSRPARPARPVPRSRFAWRELLSECLAGVLQRPGRSALTAVGTVLGVGTFVAVLGLTATASSQIDERFNTLTATEVTVEDVSAQASEFVDQAFPPDADERVSRLNGVRHAGVYWTVRLGAGQAVRSTPVGGPAAARDPETSRSSPPPPERWKPRPPPSPRAGSTTPGTMPPSSAWP